MVRGYGIKTIIADEPLQETTEGGEAVEKGTEETQDTIDISGFDFALNPDVMSSQVPQTDEEKAQMERDEKDVHDACAFLLDEVIPRLVGHSSPPFPKEY